jgi:prevent-host-death family protein
MAAGNHNGAVTLGGYCPNLIWLNKLVGMDPEEIGAFEAKTHLSSLLEQVRQGKSFYITKHGKRIAELRPVSAGARLRRRGKLKGKIWMAADFDAPLDQFTDYMP